MQSARAKLGLSVEGPVIGLAARPARRKASTCSPT